MQDEPKEKLSASSYSRACTIIKMKKFEGGGTKHLGMIRRKEVKWGIKKKILLSRKERSTSKQMLLLEIFQSRTNKREEARLRPRAQ